MPTASLSDRMKAYEEAEAGHRLLQLLPVLARIDGRSFSTFTRGLRRPFDERLSRAMIDTTKYLVTETAARVGYTQSDEITLLWYSDNPKQEIFFGGRVQKMVSVLASLATVALNRLLLSTLAEYAARRPVFDCRVWVVPNADEAANVFLWREMDATRNSISMAAQSEFSHDELVGKSSSVMQEMLHSRGINWNEYPAHFKRGTYVQRKRVRRRFSRDEVVALPPEHAAHRDPQLEVERTEVMALDMPPIGQVPNRVAVLFDGAEPEPKV